MRFIKRLDIFILKNFLTLFAGTFCISLFVVMMQFVWKYIDDLVGKGLTFDVYVKFFFYVSESLVPMALPLAILLASLISFGNIGERLELLAIKAAGVSLIRTLRPLIILNIILSGISFYFQNDIGPEAQKNVMMLLRAMHEKSPEMDIPEGAFYDGIPNNNIYVRRKNTDTGMLYDVIIYNLQDGVSRAHIILADSAKMETASDKTSMLLHLYQGELFEDFNNNNMQIQAQNAPYRRETFVEKHFIIDFDSNFQEADQESVAGSALTKNMDQLVHDIDSMEFYYDSLCTTFYAEMKRNALKFPHKARLSDYDSLAVATMDTVSKANLTKEENVAMAAREKRAYSVPKSSVNIDTIFNNLDSYTQQQIVVNALQKAGFVELDSEIRSSVITDGDKEIRKHWIQYWKKLSTSLACLMFFFIGAPLGAIIRKGGLGFPVVIAVIIFIVYYIIDTFGMKVSREGEMPVALGMWLSTIVLAPLGIWFTVKSNNDSAVFNMDAYVALWKKALGIRPKRHITRKEVIIYDPDYKDTAMVLEDLIETSRNYLGTLPRFSLLGYISYIFKYWFSKREDMQAEGINNIMEYVVDVLSNSKDRKVLLLLNGYPVMDTRSFRFYRRRRKDLRAIIQYSEKIKDHIYGNILSVQ